MQKETIAWYSSWFNSSYYHILYKDRDYKEAHSFMQHLIEFLDLNPSHNTILDLACGRGRHSVSLNKMGFNVTGLDLSPSSIAYAKDFENNSLFFDIHDMRKPYHQKFDAVFNLFTSFGYFDNHQDNLNTLKAIKSNLKPNGKAVLDFMNINYVLKNLVASETKTIQDITFNIKRYTDTEYIYKEIKFIHNQKQYHFTEKVQLLTLANFETYFAQANIQLIKTFGSYDLQDFNSQTSPRLILIFS